jgi:ubiquinone biosynthesis protein COQ9
VAGLCPRGPIELVDFFLDDAKSQLSSKVESLSDFNSLRVTEKIITITEARLMMTAPIIKQWPQVRQALS